MNNDELIKAVCPLINDTGWAYYFAPDTVAKATELGLNGMEFYVLGRGGPLGDCDSSAVAAAFGYFNPAVIARAWDGAVSKVKPRDAGKAHLECSAQLGRAKLGSVANLEAFVKAADAVNNAADADGLALYAAIKSEPLVSDTAGRAMQLVTVLREFRGSAHLVAIRALGLTAKQAHFVKRPNDIKMFGWTTEDTPQIDDDVHAKMLEVEALTDKIVAPAFGVLDDAGRNALLAGAQAIKAAVSQVS